MHDKNGNPLKVGDRVTVEGEITSTSATDDYCNVTLKVGEKDQEHGPHNVTGTLVVNAKQTTLIEES
jgi:tartrate dehydratase beta subunit/fumarate hydratase class I family protein